MQNPYPEIITDETSGIEVKNQRHIIWDEGARAERMRIRQFIENDPYKYFIDRQKLLQFLEEVLRK